MTRGAGSHVITSKITVEKSLGATGVWEARKGSWRHRLQSLLPDKPPGSSTIPPCLSSPSTQPISTFTVPSLNPPAVQDLSPRGGGLFLRGLTPSREQKGRPVSSDGRSGHCSPWALSQVPWSPTAPSLGGGCCWALLAPFCLFIYYDFLVQLKGLLSRRV